MDKIQEVQEWPKYLFREENNDFIGVEDQVSLEAMLADGWRLATSDEITFGLNAQKVLEMKYSVIPYLAAWIIECKKRIDQVTISTVDITAIIGATYGNINVTELNKIIAENEQTLSEYAICAKLFIEVFRAWDKGTVESMLILNQLTHTEIYEACRTIWNNVSLKNLDSLENHGFDRELYEKLHEHSTNPTV